MTKALSKDVDIKGVPLNVSQYLDIEKLDSEANVFIENVIPPNCILLDWQHSYSVVPEESAIPIWADSEH